MQHQKLASHKRYLIEDPLFDINGIVVQNEEVEPESNEGETTEEHTESHITEE